ncbi:MAG: helix-turn-helix transcriptional regulator [Gemmatimonadota bacterium]|nr:MAG: helix-turn-helix transcriptional regulator [Gemmatimonadota bacterium]
MRIAKFLEAHDWLDAGLELLRVRGIGGVRVDPLCRRVGVTKGSFYHYFANRTAFREQLIERWREITMPQPEQVAALARRGSLEDRIRAMLDHIREHDLGRYDLAMRTWAKEDTQARQAVEAVDRVRLSATSRMFEADGWAREAALERARILFYYIAGRYEVEGRAPTPEEGARVAQMLARTEGGCG